MLQHLSAFCLVVALVAAVLGYGLLAGFTFDSAKITFYVFAAISAAAFLADAFTPRPAEPA